MYQKYFNALAYSIFGGSVATTCLGLMNYYEKKKANASEGTLIDSDKASPYLWNNNWDRRDVNLKPEKPRAPRSIEDENKYNEQIDSLKPTATRNIILIRHGQYNLKGEKDSERFLTELGRKQADAVGLRLKNLQFPYTKIIHSTMTRAIETADLIHKHFPNLEMASTDLLREGAPIPPDPPVKHWKPEDRLQHYFADSARIEAAFRKYFHRADPSQKENSFEVIVCHANVIRYFVCRAMQFPPEAWLRFSLHHCSITWLAIRPSGRVSTYVVGDFGHLPIDLMTTS